MAAKGQRTLRSAVVPALFTALAPIVATFFPPLTTVIRNDTTLDHDHIGVTPVVPEAPAEDGRRRGYEEKRADDW